MAYIRFKLILKTSKVLCSAVFTFNLGHIQLIMLMLLFLNLIRLLIKLYSWKSIVETPGNLLVFTVNLGQIELIMLILFFNFEQVLNY